jgi:hypothetical protein
LGELAGSAGRPRASEAILLPGVLADLDPVPFALGDWVPGKVEHPRIKNRPIGRRFQAGSFQAAVRARQALFAFRRFANPVATGVGGRRVARVVFSEIGLAPERAAVLFLLVHTVRAGIKDGHLLPRDGRAAAIVAVPIRAAGLAGTTAVSANLALVLDTIAASRGNRFARQRLETIIVKTIGLPVSIVVLAVAAIFQQGG